MGVPLTADYDLFCVAPHLSNFSAEKSTGLKSAANKVLAALATRERRNADADLGKNIGVNSVSERSNQ